MFEDKEEYIKAKAESKAKITKVIKIWNAEEATIHDVAFQEGTKLGFQLCAKARLNVTSISDCPIKDEWHYVKNGDSPVREDYYVIACHSATGNFTDRCQWLNNEWWVADGETRHFINEKVYAWKEKPEPPEE